jgi:uncharacterized protein YegL
MSNSSALDHASYTFNREQRTLCALIVDCSGSMSEGNKIGAINTGLKALEVALKNDPVARKRVRILIIECYGDTPVKGQWVDADEFVAPTLMADGFTPLGKSTHMALDEIEASYVEMRRNGTPRTKPWVFLFSDGGPNDPNWETGAARLRDWTAAKEGNTWVFAAEGADIATLQRFQAVDGVVYRDIATAEYGKLFKWLSSSLSVAAAATPGTAGTMPSPGVGNQSAVVF